jgi:hypothetical protein
MTIKAHLATIPEKYRATATAIHTLLVELAGNHEITLRPNGMIWVGLGSDGFMLAGMCARKSGVMLYASADVLSFHAETLGKLRTGKTCVRLRKMSNLRREVLRDIIRKSLAKERMNYRG